MLLLLTSYAAFARDWYLETPERADPAGPEAVRTAAVGAGLDARVVRRFVDGEWRYLGQVEGFADEPAAEAAAHTLVAATGIAVAVVQADGGEVVAREEVAPQPGGGRADEAADAEIAAVVRAHGSAAGTLERLQDGPVLFEYRRELPGGKAVDHRWAAEDGALYCEVFPVQGALIASRTRVVGEAAALSVAGGEWARADARKAREALEALGPTAVIPLVLALGDAVSERRELQQVEIVGNGRADGVATRVLAFAGDATAGPLKLEVGANDHLIRRAEFEDGALVYEFADYHAADGLAVPRRVTTRREGVVVDRVLVDQLRLGGEIPAEWFAPIR